MVTHIWLDQSFRCRRQEHRLIEPVGKHLPLQHQEEGGPLGKREESKELLTLVLRWEHSISVRLWASQLMLAAATTTMVRRTGPLTIDSQFN